MRRLSKKLLCSLLAFGCVFATNVNARQAEVYDAADPQMILNFARGEGRADLIQEQGHDPVIKGKINGINYSLFFVRCENNQNCKGLEFLVQFNPDKKKPYKLEAVNKFNHDYTAATAYISENKTLYFTRNLSFNGGQTEVAIDNFVQMNAEIIRIIQSGNFQ